MKLPFKVGIGMLFLFLISGCAGRPTAVTVSPGLPELTPHIPDGWSAPIIFDQETLSFKIAWTNRGGSMAEDYSILLLIDGAQLAEWYKPVTAPGRIKTQTVKLRDIPNPSALMNSRHTFELILDPQNTVAESNEDNNTFLTQQDISFELPDLEPHLPSKLLWDQPVVFGGADLVFGTRPAPADGGYFMAYSVTNSGGGEAQSWGGTTQLAVNGLSVRQSYMDQIGDPEPQPGAFVISAIPIWKIALMEGPLMPGTHQVD